MTGFNIDVSYLPISREVRVVAAKDGAVLHYDMTPNQAESHGLELIRVARQMRVMISEGRL